MSAKDVFLIAESGAKNPPLFFDAASARHTAARNDADLLRYMLDLLPESKGATKATREWLEDRALEAEAERDAMAEIAGLVAVKVDEAKADDAQP